MAPTFTVIIPTFDRPALLVHAVASVLAQDWTDFECLVVDDGSPVAPSLPADPRVRLVRHSENRGLPTALNTGLDAAKGDFVTFLDDDDLYTPDRLSAVAERCSPGIVVLSKWHSIGGRTYAREPFEGWVHDTILDSWAPPKGAAVLPRASTPRFDPTYVALEDLEWWLRVTDVLPFTTVDHVGYLVRPHRGTRNLNGPSARIDFGLRLLDEHSDYFTSHPRAAAQRWFSIGLIARDLGDFNLARSAFRRSLRIHLVPKRFGHLALSCRPSTTGVPSVDPVVPGTTA